MTAGVRPVHFRPLETPENHSKAEDGSYLNSSVAVGVVERLEPIIHCYTRKLYDEANVHVHKRGAGSPLGSSARRVHSSITRVRYVMKHLRSDDSRGYTCNTSIVLGLMPSA